MAKIKKNPRLSILKKRRDIRKKILNVDNEASGFQRRYSEATKIRRAIKTELFGNDSKGKDTSLELFIEEIFKKNNIKYIPQKRVRWCNYDFYLPEYNILIEVNGEYWHVDHRIYPNGPKNDIQRRNMKKNEMKRDIAKSSNIPLIEIWENEIEKFPEETTKNLLYLLESKKKYEKP